MGRTCRWGVLGPGRIAGQFARGLAVLDDAELVAVGSRSQENANRFAEEFDVPRRHSSYAELAADPDVDAVYVATPHPAHVENAILCLEAGKAVLCEKPFAVNASQVERMIGVARERGVFLMEAMWTRFLPLLVQVRQWLADGTIGEVRMVKADFGFRSDLDPQGRLFNPELAGGALLDIGCYTISLASMVFGTQPDRIVSMTHLGETGVDEQSAMIFGYPEGQLAILTCAVRTGIDQDARIYGTEGMIRLPASWWRGTQATLMVGEEEQTVDLPYDGTGYNCEAAEVMRCLEAGKLESAFMPLDESLAIMQTMDRVREQWGLTYPME